MIEQLFAWLQPAIGGGPLVLVGDVADVLIVAYLIYRVLLLLKGTRAMQMGIGLALVFATHLLARYTGLATLYTMLDGLLTYIVLIAVVVFQNDIRRALMRFGRRPLFRAVRNSQETQGIEEVIKATTALGQQKIGALIVFERDAALDEFIEPGTVLDAGISKELLYSIFVPSHENPMHDGAVIIRDRRIWQAGAFLPLTASPKLDRTLGTRHRAAIGISEETDAVVVVVSEERGQVSVCFNGNMARNLDAHSLREALLGLFYRQSAAPKRPTRPEMTGRTTIPPTAVMAVVTEERERASQSSTQNATQNAAPETVKDKTPREAEEVP